MIVLRDPLLALLDHAVAVTHVLHHGLVWQLTVTVPLIEKQLGHADRFFGTAVLGDEKKREVLPR